MALVKLYADEEYRVHHLRAIIQENGIHAVVMGDSLGSARGDIPLTVETLPAIWINADDIPRARPLVERFILDNVSPTPPPPPWQCSNCNEHIEGQFTTCWNCGQDRTPHTPD